MREKVDGVPPNIQEKTLKVAMHRYTGNLRDNFLVFIGSLLRAVPLMTATGSFKGEVMHQLLCVDYNRN